MALTQREDILSFAQVSISGAGNHERRVEGVDWSVEVGHLGRYFYSLFGDWSSDLGSFAL